MLESMAINIEKLFYDVHTSVEGPLYSEQTAIIAELLEAYKNRNNPLTPNIEHYKKLKKINRGYDIVLDEYRKSSNIIKKR